MSNDFLNKISTLIPSMFPDFYQESGPQFINFLQQYYTWLEQIDSPLGNLRSLLSYDDIDTTTNDQIVHFKNKYLYNIQFNIASNPRLFLKHSLDFYRSKGTINSIDLFFRLVYGISSEVYYPGNDTFKLSDAQWISPKYLEVTATDNNVSYIGQQISGTQSGATAFVDRLVKRYINGRYIDIFYIEDITGTFQISESLVCSVVDKSMVLPVIIGSLSNVRILTGGSNFSIGNVVEINSALGQDGIGVVTSLATQRGLVNFNLEDGGWGYTLTPQILISNNVLSVSNVVISNPFNPTTFNNFETIISPMANISYSSLSGSLIAGETINEYSGANVSGTGTILSVSSSNTTAGSITVSVNRFSNGSLSNLNSNSIFWVAGNTSSATLVSYSDQTATANLMATSSNSTLYINNITGNFSIGETIIQYNGANISGIGQVVSVDTNAFNGTVSVSNVSGIFMSGEVIDEAIVVGASTDATANLISLSTSIGVVSVSNTFSVLPGNYFYGLSSNTTGTITSISQGSGANFNIRDIDNVEQILSPTDLLSANSSYGVPYLTLKLNGSNSNGAANSYGFPQFPSGNSTTPLYKLLAYEQVNVGSISALGGINQGNSYTANPFVEIYEKYTADQELHDFIVTVANSSNFSIGEIVTQNISIANTTSLTVNAVSAPFTLGELVYQSNGTANVGTGLISNINVVSNSGTITLSNVSGAYTNTFHIIGGLSNANAVVLSVNNNILFTAKGIVKPKSNSTVLYLERISSYEFVAGTSNNITGTQTGATGIITQVLHDVPPQSGLNAVIDASATIASGIIAGLNVTGSGFGFYENDIGNISLPGNNTAPVVSIQTSAVGINPGYYTNNKGFLSDTIYVLDSDYYQEYSYEIISKLPFEYYANTIKSVLHVAGTKVFGAVDISSNTTALLSPTIDSNSSVFVP